MLGVAGHRSAGGDPLLLCSRGEARPQDGGRPWRGRHGRVLLPGEVLQTCKLPCTPTSQAPDTGDAVYKLTYTADMDGFQAMGDHLPVSVIFYTKAGFQIFVQVIMDPVPEVELPAMVDYTPEVGVVISLCLLISQFAGGSCQG